MRAGLRDLGWIEGRNILIDFRWAEGNYDRLPELAAELVRLNVDVLVTHGSTGALASRKATSTVPIVITALPDMLALGLVESLSRPGGNITGLTWEPTAEILGKHVELLSELSPRPSRVAGIVDLSTPLPSYWKQADYAAQRRGMTLQQMQIGPDGDVSSAFRAIASGRAEAVIVFGSPRLWARRAQISDLARKNALPTIFMFREGPDAGGLMSYGTSLTDSWRRAATYVDKVLKGTKPADLPVEQPTKFELVINLKTAKALGLTIPQSLLVRADEVIQ